MSLSGWNEALISQANGATNRIAPRHQDDVGHDPVPSSQSLLRRPGVRRCGRRLRSRRAAAASTVGVDESALTASARR